MTYRVIQWSTGNVGFHALRHIIRNPQLKLVGVHAHGASKVGKDAAELCGLTEEVGKTGVIATSDIDALLALDADVVVYTTQGETRPHESIPVLARILASGKDVQATALRVINAIPQVVAHAPGMISTRDLHFPITTNITHSRRWA